MVFFEAVFSLRVYKFFCGAVSSGLFNQVWKLCPKCVNFYQMQISVKFLILILVWLSIPKPSDLPFEWNNSYIFGQTTSVQAYRTTSQSPNIPQVKLKPLYLLVKSLRVNFEQSKSLLSHKTSFFSSFGLSNFISSGAMIFHHISSSN